MPQTGYSLVAECAAGGRAAQVRFLVPRQKNYLVRHGQAVSITKEGARTRGDTVVLESEKG